MKRLQTTVEVAASLIAVAAYVYLLGGLVVWLRFTAARLQTDDAVRALDTQRLFVTGMKALLVVALILATVLGVVWLAWKAARLITFTRSEKEAAAPGTNERAEETWKAWILVLQAAIVGVVTASLLVETPAADSGMRLRLLTLVSSGVWVIVVPLTLRAINDDAVGDLLRKVILVATTLFVAAIAVWRLAAPLGIAVLALLALLHLSRRIAKLPSVKEPSKLVPTVLVLAGGLSLVVVAYMATPPVQFDRTVVVMNDESTVTGGYVGQNSEGVFLATCKPDSQDPWVSHATRLEVIAPSRFQRVVLGGIRYSFDYGKNPSLLDLAIYAFERDKIEELTDTVELDARGRKLVCGRRHLLRLTSRIRDPASHSVRQEVAVLGAGRVTLFGPDVEREIEEVSESDRLSVPVALTGVAAADVKCSKPVEVKITVMFAPKEGDPVEKSTLVDLPARQAPQCDLNAR